MMITRLIWFGRLEVILFLGGLALVVFFRMLTGGINTRYLLDGKQPDGSRRVSPERVQLLLFTLWTAISYISQVAEKHELPDIPITTLALLGGSHAIYLGGKAYSMLFKKISKGD